MDIHVNEAKLFGLRSQFKRRFSLTRHSTWIQEIDSLENSEFPTCHYTVEFIGDGGVIYSASHEVRWMDLASKNRQNIEMDRIWRELENMLIVILHENEEF